MWWKFILAYSSETGHPGGVFRGRDRPHQRDQPPHRRAQAGRGQARGHLSRPSHYIVPPETRWQRRMQEIRRRAATRRCKHFERRGQAASKPSALRSAPITTLRCCSEIGHLQGHRKLLRACCPAVPPGSTPFTLLDYFPEDFLLVCGRIATSPCRRCAPCTPATAPARRRWWSTGSACLRPLTTARLNLRSFMSKLNQIDLCQRHARRL